MIDNSNLNNKYFIDDKAFNCPFCGLRNTKYTILAIIEYDISKEKKGKIIFVRCDRCCKVSVHFAPYEMKTTQWRTDQIGVVRTDNLGYSLVESLYSICFKNSREDDSPFDVDLDSKIYHSIPNSFFTMDERIPKEMRKLFDEAQECKKANLKIGASACLRKLVYTILSEQLNKKAGKEKQSLRSLGYEHYSDCIQALKEYHPDLEILIAPLSDITGITSEQVHENSWEEISSRDLSVCLETIKELLYAIYVHPAVLKERIARISQMKNNLSKKKKAPDDCVGKC